MINKFVKLFFKEVDHTYNIRSPSHKFKLFYLKLHFFLLKVTHSNKINDSNTQINHISNQHAYHFLTLSKYKLSEH